jgi:hypothetical protein
MSIKQSIKDGNERGARRQLFEELFNDFYRSRHKVYLMNFVRGIFFGFGSVLGGTVVVAIIIWILSQLAGWFPPIGEAIHNFITTLQR